MRKVLPVIIVLLALQLFAAPTAVGDWRAGQSIFYPKYIAEGTVYTRGVKDMPVLPNSKEIAAYMAKMPSEYNKQGVITSANLTSFNLPIYVVDSRDPGTTWATVHVPEFRNNMVNAELRKTMFTDKIPIPKWARRAEGGDHSMAIYDIATGILREYFCVEKKSDIEWTASYGGYVTNFRELSKCNYAMQMENGTCFAPGILGGPAQIGIEEARRGKINHAVIFTMANPRRGVFSWPAFQTDGSNDNPLAPCEGQWFRIPPNLNLKKLNLKPLTYLVAKACQEYGGFASDRNLFCHAFNFEPGYAEEKRTGKNPWSQGGELWNKYGLRDNLMNDFPWEYTEWAPVDWGKNEKHRTTVSSSGVNKGKLASTGVTRWDENWGPRQVKIHALSVELGDSLEAAVVIQPAPEGDPGASSILVDPMSAARKAGFVAAINATAFMYPLDAPANEKKAVWYPGKHVRLFGLAVADGVQRNPPHAAREVLWFDEAGIGHVGAPGPDDKPVQAVSDWEGPILKNGELQSIDSKVRYQRAFAGISEDGTQLVLAVARGGPNSGLTLSECGQYLLEHGCSDGINFDGGGSACLMADEGNGLKCVFPMGNRRPVPVILGVRPCIW